MVCCRSGERQRQGAGAFRPLIYRLVWARRTLWRPHPGYRASGAKGGSLIEGFGDGVSDPRATARVETSRDGPRPHGMLLKRGLDLVGAAIGLVLLSPVLLVVGLLIA